MAKKRDVILARVFFSDSPENKIRPAIVDRIIGTIKV